MGKGGAVRWTPEQLAEYERRFASSPVLPDRPLVAPPRTNAPPVLDALGKPASRLQMPAPSATAQSGSSGPGEAFYALGRLAKGRMNKTEAAYAQRLEALKHDGQILDWRFHVLRVRLADNTFYEPDFLVMTAGRELQIHETKGSFTTQSGQTKIKLCAEVLPWFRVIKASRQKDGSWILQEFNP